MGERPGPPAPPRESFPFPPITSIAAAFAAAPQPRRFFPSRPPSRRRRTASHGRTERPERRRRRRRVHSQSAHLLPNIGERRRGRVLVLRARAEAEAEAARRGVPSEAEDARFLARARSAADADDGGRVGVRAGDGRGGEPDGGGGGGGRIGARGRRREVEVVARAARGGVHVAPPMSSTVSSRVPTRLVNEASPRQCARAALSFVTFSARGTRPRMSLKGLTLEGGVERGDDHRLARRGPTLAPGDPRRGRLALVDADDVEGVDDVVHLGESARGEGGERLPVVGDDASLEVGEASVPPAAAPGSLSYRVSPAYFTTRH